MKLDIKKEISLDKKTLIFASLPDMGSVGGLVSSFLCNSLSTVHIGSILSNEKPWVSYSDGIVKNIIDCSSHRFAQNCFRVGVAASNIRGSNDETQIAQVVFNSA